MTPNPLQRPKPPRKIQPQGNQQRNQTPSTSHPASGGNRGNNGNRNNNNGGNNQPPSPWLDETPSPDSTASFVEYLRWMREPDHPYKDATKVQILQLATEKANYREHLTTLNQRLELMAGKDNTFTVKCAWRIRVGGHRGPESILLPAFDALGMPYIPSSTLRGVARTQAIREVMEDKGIDWKEAEKEPEIVKHFGSLEADKQDKAGKVIFFDAYPLPNEHGLEMDMANNIWKWENNQLKYASNPNVFLSLKEPTFKIGLKLVNGLKDPKILEKVKQWLIKGLQTGVGSQVNTGYGEFLIAGKEQPSHEFFRVKFGLEGQLIHGYQRLNQGQTRGNPVAEVRPIAFKSMLRYWFRAFTLGVLEPKKVQELEAQLFGGIDPQQWGWLKVNIEQWQLDRKEPKTKDEKVGQESGILILSHSLNSPNDYKESLEKLCKNLTWLMFNLGGVGQGARRPCYSRKNRPNPRPFYRGSTLIVKDDNPFWDRGETIQEFKPLFQKKLITFYQALGSLTSEKLNYRNLKSCGRVNQSQWENAIDRNCRIVVCSGQTDFDKPYALATLHHRDFKHNDRYDRYLCGENGKPSPVWIADLGDFQVVTVFGATENPRKSYLEKLHSYAQEIAQIFPL